MFLIVTSEGKQKKNQYKPPDFYISFSVCNQKYWTMNVTDFYFILSSHFMRKVDWSYYAL